MYELGANCTNKNAVALYWPQEKIESNAGDCSSDGYRTYNLL